MLDLLRKCLNWKVVTGLIVVGLGVWVAAPGAIGAALPFLVLLACPLSMIGMMPRSEIGGLRSDAFSRGRFDLLGLGFLPARRPPARPGSGQIRSTEKRL